jgi:hypothetical protein
MANHLESKTLVGLLILLSSIIGLVAFGKLSPEAMDGIKWIGGLFMTVRLGANVMENLPGAKKD